MTPYERKLLARALKAVHDSWFTPSVYEHSIYGQAALYLEKDTVEVVRCKDCKFSGMYCFGASREPKLACLDIEEDGFVRMATAADPEGYCSHAERKDND